MLKYFLWCIWRLHSSTVSQHIPGWAGFISETGQVSERFTTIDYHPISNHLTTDYSTVQECLRAGVSNSRPSEPFNTARETVLKFLMNFTSCHRTRFLINEAWRRAMVWRCWRGNDLFFEIDLTAGYIIETVARSSGDLQIENIMRHDC